MAITYKIRVAWFASSFANRTATGTGQVAKQAIINLLKNHKKEVFVYLLCKSKEELNYIKNDISFLGAVPILLPEVKGAFLRGFRQYIKYSLLNRKIKLYDIVHFSVPRLYPFFWKFPSKHFVCTFHSAGDITAPSEKFVFSRKVYNLISKLFWRKLSSVIADSEEAKIEIINFYKISEKIINVVLPGANTFWTLKHNPSLELSKFIDSNKNKKLVIIVGRWQLFKNVHGAIRAFKYQNSQTLSSILVVLVGKKNFDAKDLVEKEINSNRKLDYSTFNYLSDQDLAFLYRKAEIVIHPSINEGFGLPAFEAFGQGSKMIVHNLTPAASLLANNKTVITTDTTKPKMLSNSISRILKPQKTSINIRRQQIQKLGATWESMTKNYLNIYKSVCGNAVKNPP